MDAQYIRLFLYPLEAGFFGESTSKTGLVFVISQHIYIKSAELFSKGFAHIAITKDPHGFSGQLLSPVLLPIPDFLPYLAVSPRQVVEQSQQHPNSMLGDSVSVAFGRVI